MDVAIVKYNAGNIYSVVNAMKRLGIEPVLTDDAEMLQKADRVLFPGQGQAREAMEYLKAHQLDQVIKNLKQPVLGICVGQQLLCRHSEEGDVDCIGIFDVDVISFPFLSTILISLDSSVLELVAYTFTLASPAVLNAIALPLVLPLPESLILLVKSIPLY